MNEHDHNSIDHDTNLTQHDDHLNKHYNNLVVFMNNYVFEGHLFTPPRPIYVWTGSGLYADFDEE